MGVVHTVNLTKAAFERLCELRDLIDEKSGHWYPLNEVLSAFICELPLDRFEEILNETSS